MRALAPPKPVQLNVKVKRNFRTEIPLRIYGARGELLKFIIRSAPEHGKLTEPRQVEKESAAVIYDPPDDLGITHDRFLYAVQSSEGVSAAVEVLITIVDEDPVLVIAPPIEFPKIMAGKSSEQTFELKNKGGGVATGEMVVDEPWRIIGSNSYRINAGETAKFRLVFEPKEGGVYDGAISYTSNRDHSTSLHGEAIAPLAVSTESIVLRNVPGETLRSASFDIINETDQPRTLKINSSAALKTPADVTVAPHSRTTVPVQTLAADVQSLDEVIRVESEGFARNVTVKSAAVGPLLRFTASALDFGKLPPKKAVSRPMEVENIGGVAGALSLEIPAPFLVEPSSMTIQPGEKKTAQVKLPDSAFGTYRTWLKLKSGAQELELRVTADLSAGGVPSRSTNARVAPSDASSSDASGGDSTPPPEKLKPSLPLEWGTVSAPAPGVLVLGTTVDTATLAWPDNISTSTEFRVDLRHIGLDPNRSMAVMWLPTPATVTHENGRYVAKLTDLKPSQIWAVRVMPLNSYGEAGNRLFALDFSTPAVAPNTPQISTIQWLLLAFAVCFGFVIWGHIRRPKGSYL